MTVDSVRFNMSDHIDNPQGWTGAFGGSNFKTTEKAGSFEDYKAILTAIWQLAGGNPILDLGVGEGHVTKHFDGDYVDLVLRPTSPAKTMQFDIRDAPTRLAKFSYKLMIMSDVIEHLSKTDAIKLLRDMWPRTRAMFIFTPIGPWKLDWKNPHPDAHKSGWLPYEFWCDGWEVMAWTRYHRFEGGEELGAFFAWKFRDEPTPSTSLVLKKAGVTL